MGWKRTIKTRSEDSAAASGIPASSRPVPCRLVASLAGLVTVVVFPAVVFAAGPIRVVTSIAPLAMIVSQLGGDRVLAHSILPPGADPHVFEPRPSDAKDVRDADLVVLLGSAIDDWLGGGIPLSPDTNVVRLAPDEDGAAHHEHGHDADDDRQHDPHVWLDPSWVRDRALPALHRAFVAADPEGAPRYGVAARAMAEDLTNLEDDIREMLVKAPVRVFFAWHPAWGHFAHRFGLRSAGVVGEGEGREPSLRAMVDAISAARAAGVRAVLVEPQVDPRPARVLATELGVPVVTVDPLGDAWSFDRATYPELMLFNARAFARALGVEEDDDEEEEVVPPPPMSISPPGPAGVP
jgi:ABC-type Zn uptake system ZnuABC Zn-binding protein ZnuA